MTGMKALSMSTKEIRKVAKLMREKIGLRDCLKIPICNVLEWVLEHLFPRFEWEIVSEKDLAVEGMTLVSEKKIFIREDVYEKACQGDGRARFTIAHEIGHLILHLPGRLAQCRLSHGESLRPFEDPEWQADSFAAEFLMDYDLIKGMPPKEIQMACGVSETAAIVRYEKIRKEWR